MKIYAANWYFSRVLASPKRVSARERERERIKERECISTLTSCSSRITVNKCQVVGEGKRTRRHCRNNFVVRGFMRIILKAENLHMRRVSRLSPTVASYTLSREYNITFMYTRASTRASMIVTDVHIYRIIVDIEMKDPHKPN